MKIGIVGAGNVGGTLGKRWAEKGHTVVFSSRNPKSSEMQKLVSETGHGASADSVASTVSGSEVVLLATPWPGTRDAIAGAGNLAGKILIDATNPLRADLSGLELGTDTSGGEQVAAWASGARVVKAFNTVGFKIMANPVFDGARTVLFYCGDDAEAKRTVAQLASELGFDAQDAGPLSRARCLEPLALLWISLAIVQGLGPNFAFQILKR